jgi:hypothetical protein
VAAGHPQRSVPDRNGLGPARPAIFRRLARSKAVRWPEPLAILEAAMGRFGISAAHQAPRFPRRTPSQSPLRRIAGLEHHPAWHPAANLKLLNRAIAERVENQQEPADLGTEHEVRQFQFRAGLIFDIQLQIEDKLRLLIEYWFAIAHGQAANPSESQPLASPDESLACARQIGQSQFSHGFCSSVRWQPPDAKTAADAKISLFLG